MLLMRICFLRHGPTEWNALGRIQGHTDIPLSAPGLAQMQGLAPPDPFGPSYSPRVFSSPLLRARQTAEALGLLNPTLDVRLMEQNWGRWEGLSRVEIMARDGENCFAAAGLKAAFTPPGGESTKDLLARVAAFLKDVAAGEGDAVAIAHLGVLRSAYTLATGWDMAAPMPEGLDVSKALILTLAPALKLDAMNVDLKPRKV
jgi:broad specificity phosphatase PhoE